MIKNLQSKENEIGLFNKWAGYWVNLESMNQCATFRFGSLEAGKGGQVFCKACISSSCWILCVVSHEAWHQQEELGGHREFHSMPWAAGFISLM